MSDVRVHKSLLRQFINFVVRTKSAVWIWIKLKSHLILLSWLNTVKLSTCIKPSLSTHQFAGSSISWVQDLCRTNKSHYPCPKSQDCTKLSSWFNIETKEIHVGTKVLIFLSLIKLNIGEVFQKMKNDFFNIGILPAEINSVKNRSFYV